MARFSAGVRTGTGTNLLPATALVGATTVRPRIAEVHVSNTTALEVNIALVRLTTAGTPGASVTIVRESDTSQTSLAAVNNTYTVGPTITAGLLRNFTIGAAKGSGIMWTFGPLGLVVPDVAAAGVGIIFPTGTGQVLDVTWVWDE